MPSKGSLSSKQITKKKHAPKLDYQLGNEDSQSSNSSRDLMQFPMKKTSPMGKTPLAKESGHSGGHTSMRTKNDEFEYLFSTLTIIF